MNIYKRLELWSKYRRIIPLQYWGDAFYQKPDDILIQAVKKEKKIRHESKGRIKLVKYEAVVKERDEKKKSILENVEQLAFSLPKKKEDDVGFDC